MTQENPEPLSHDWHSAPAARDCPAGAIGSATSNETADGSNRMLFANTPFGLPSGAADGDTVSANPMPPEKDIAADACGPLEARTPGDSISVR
jgi:hypothetical protein